MIKNIPYFKYIECADFIYSVDSVVITFSFEQEIAEKIFSSLDFIHGLFSCIDIKSDVEFYYQRIVFETNYNSTNYKNLKSHIAISRGLDGTANGFIHFNPNRLFQSEKAYDEIKRFLGICSSVTVKKCDVAIDMPYDITSLTPMKSRKSMMVYIESRKSYTFYWGKRNEEGYAKLYSKSLKNKLDTPVTRLEITLGNPDEGDWNKVLANAVPPIYVPPFRTGDPQIRLTSPELVIIKLASYLLNGILQRVMIFRILELYEDKARRKIVKDIILTGSQQLRVDYEAINKIVKDVIEDIIGNQCD